MPLSRLDLGIESSIDTIRRQLANRLTVSADEGTNQPTASSGSSCNASLSTPPLSKPSLEEAPFKAKDDDEVSLSMKKRHNRTRRRLSRGCASNGDLDDKTSSPVVVNQSRGRSRSMPELQVTDGPSSPPSGNFSDDEPGCRRPSADSKREGLPRRPRRWTMPSKAAPAKAHIDLSYPLKFVSVPKRPPALRRASTRTPAMISLRRATTIRKAPLQTHPSVYTSFPTPSFNRTKSNFLTKIWGADEHEPERHPTANTQGRDLRRASIVDNHNARPGTSEIAAPVHTEMFAAPYSPQQTRRCSTRYMTRNSVYEVIWDENVTISVSTSSSSGRSRSTTDQGKIRGPEPSTDPQTHSVAMDKLETQLFKGIQQSRKTSLAKNKLGLQLYRAETQLFRQESRRNSVEPHDPSPDILQHQISFQDLLDFKFSRFKNNAALTNLPRSRAGKKSITTVASPKESDADFGQLVDFFPPLATRAVTHTATAGKDVIAPLARVLTSIDIQEGKQPAVDDNIIADGRHASNSRRRPRRSFVGQSPHARRHRSDPWRQRPSLSTTMPERIETQERSVSVAIGRRWSGRDEDDTAPLLGSMPRYRH